MTSQCSKGNKYLLCTFCMLGMCFRHWNTAKNKSNSPLLVGFTFERQTVNKKENSK